MDEKRPDLVVSIDFGMTCTGVAYANPSIGSNTVRWIQKWPGRMQANENKVPTILVYPTDQPTPSSWGFLSETETEKTAINKQYREWFKTYLDEGCLLQGQAETKNSDSVPQSIGEVEKWYTDYFRFLYQHIEYKLQMELAARWEDAKIEFIFSVPTTWRPHPTVERFRRIVHEAGFGKHPSHSATIGLTEAEAAAVHMAFESPAVFNERDILLVCDIGGGTTDLSLLRVLGTNGGSLNLQQLDVVFGANLGSAQIDRRFELSVLDRLGKANDLIPLEIDLEDAAWEMMKGREYQNAKCDYGSPDDTETFFVAIPKLRKSYNNLEYGIANGEMRFERNDLQALFDTQVSKLYDMIDGQLQRASQKFPDEQVAHLVLSGGLGNSAYVQQCLRRRYHPRVGARLAGSSLQVRVAPDPQLTVCKGIIADRLRKLQSGKAVLGWRCCRASYGTLCKVLYDPKNPLHFGQATTRDVADGRLYIADVIDWFIKQVSVGQEIWFRHRDINHDYKGEAVSIDDPIVRPFSQKVLPTSDYRVFPTAVVTSELDKDYLPYTLNKYCLVLCNVQSDFSSIDLDKFKLKNRHFWSKGDKYHRVEYVVKVALGPADIHFELWLHGQKLSKDNPIRVEWIPAPPPIPNTFSSPQLKSLSYQSQPTTHSSKDMYNHPQWGYSAFS